MKYCHCARPLFVALVFLIALCAQSTQCPAQTVLPGLDAAPEVLRRDNTITLSLASGATLPQNNSTQRIALYEKDRPNRIFEIKRKFALQNGRWSTQVKLEADPGAYELRLVSDEKSRAALTQPATVLIPGIVREPGWWLLNGSPFAEAPRQVDSPAPLDAPLFIPGLKRDGKKFSRKIIRSDAPLSMRVLALPRNRQLLDANFDFAAWRAQAEAVVQEARDNGERNLLGIVIRAPSLIRDDNAGAVAVGKRLREIVNQIAPDAALILEVPANANYLNSNGVSAWAQFYDAVMIGRSPFLRYSAENAFAIKAVRRVAEEQANYDLPIFIATLGAEKNGMPSDGSPAPQQVFSDWMHGGSGVISMDTSILSSWSHLVSRNASLFIGAHTLEDVGIWPPVDAPAVDAIEELYSTLLGAGRIPHLARLGQKQEKKVPESFMTILGDAISAETIEKLIVAAKGGATIYLEGTPKIEGDAAIARWSTLVGATTKPVAEKRTTLLLDDPWLFGTARGSKVLVQQSVEATISSAAGIPPTRKNAESDKGRDILTAPRVAARLEDGTPALIENPVGDGRILWVPHRIISSTTASSVTAYYAAIAAQQSKALVQVRSGEQSNNSPVRAVLRRSPKGTWIVGLFNESTQAAPITLEANYFAGVALDLAGEKELPLRKRGNRSFVESIVPEYGWQIIALGESRKVLDEERFAPRSKAKLR